MTGLRLLVAEDERIVREIIGRALAGKGYVVALAADGQAALDAFRPGLFDAVLMDVQMPGLDGPAATARLRALERAAGARPVPVVALTAAAGPDEVARCRGAGMDLVLRKPIDWPALFATLEGLRGAAVPAGAEAGSPAPEARPAVLDQGVLDEAILAELAALIGRDRAAAFLARFGDEVRTALATLDDPAATDADRAAKAHALAAFAGQLGFAELASACAAVQAGGGPAPLAALRAAAGRAVAVAARRLGEADRQG